MTQQTDSYNCVDVVIDASQLPPSRPTPISPKMRERIRKEQELLRQAGGQIPPPTLAEFSDGGPEGQSPVAK